MEEGRGAVTPINYIKSRNDGDDDNDNHRTDSRCEFIPGYFAELVAYLLDE